MSVDGITILLKRYNSTQLFLWTEVTAIHPANQFFHLRFEYLLAILFSIQPDEFEGHDLTRDSFVDIVSSLEKLSSEFRTLEDWDPFPQLKLVPFFINREKFFFFYGDAERPYEDLRQLVYMYSIQSGDSIRREFALVKKLFLSSLRHQTEILSTLIGITAKAAEHSGIYVPTQSFFDLISPMFRMSPQEIGEIDILPVVKEGFVTGSERDILVASMEHQLFKTLFVHLTKPEGYYFIPQFHTSVFHDLANQILENAPHRDEIEQDILKNFVHSLERECFKFFTITNIVEILDKNTNEVLQRSPDIVAMVDRNKLLLFKVARPVAREDLTEPIERAARDLQSFIELVKSQKSISLRYLNKQSFDVESTDIEYWPVIVFETRTSNMMFLPTETSSLNNVWIVDMKDLRAIFESLESSMSLVKFLRNDSQLRTKTRVMSIDSIDRFAYYLSNGESYLRAGALPHMITFAPHLWSDYYNEKLFSRYSDNIHELIEARYPGKFNRIEKEHGNVYAFFDSIYFDGGLAVKRDGRLALITYPLEAINCTKEEIEGFSRLIGPLFADYIDRLYDQLGALLRRYDFDFEKDIFIGLYPTSYLERNEKLAFLHQFVSQLNKDRPLLAITRETPAFRSLHTWVIYDYSLLQPHFYSADNAGERLCINELVTSLITFLKPSLNETEARRVSQTFVDENVPVGKRAYSLDAIPFENPRIGDYPRCKELSQPDYSMVQQEIAEHVRKRSYTPGTYEGESAKRVCNVTFEFLQGRIEDVIRPYDRSILFYAYQILESIEAERETSRIQLAIDASKIIEYDIVKKNTDRLHRMSRLSMSARHIIETILKLGISGTQTIDEERWLYLQALAVTLYEVANVSDSIHYSIRQHSIRISDMYEVELESGESAFDIERFYTMESQLTIDSARNSLGALTREPDADIDRDFDDQSSLNRYLDTLEAAFSGQFGFSIKHALQMLTALGRLDLSDPAIFPLTMIREPDLITKLMQVDVPGIDRTEIAKILDFLSISSDSIRTLANFTPSAYLRKKKRVGLCPLVRLDSGEYVYGNQMCLTAAAIWRMSIMSAHFPYSLDPKTPVGQVLSRWHDYLDRELEKKAEMNAIKCLGKDKVEAGIDNFKRISPSLPSKPICGEIDLLVVNENVKTVFVLEVKNMTRTIRPYEMRREMDTFLGEKDSYLEKLVKKELFVRENLRSFLEHFSIAENTGWHVRKAFVVDSNYPSAHAAKAVIDFVLVDELDKYLLSA